jgi:hypothetical protein
MRTREPGKCSRVAMSITAASMAASAAALMSGPLTAAAASGGTISFVGAIAAAPLAITAAPAHSATSLKQAVVRTAGEREGVALTFNSSAGVVSGADVTLQALGSTQARDVVAARFVDSGGRAGAAHDGHYRVGRDGGVLSLAPKRAGVETPVMVVVSYN